MKHLCPATFLPLSLGFTLVLVGCTPSPSVASSVVDPAFLDAPNQVRVWLKKPMTEAEMQGKFAFSVAGKDIKISNIKAGGEPERERILPRTAGRIILAGTLQSALGAKEWDPDGEVTQMKEVSPGIHELIVKLPKGRFEYKITRNGSWAENYGAGFAAAGSNMTIVIPVDGTIVKFIVDFNAKTIKNSLENPSEITAPKTAPEPDRKVPTTFPVAILTLSQSITTDQVDDAMFVTDSGTQRRVFAREVLSAPEYRYDGQLGSIYTKFSTTFKVWSPVSSSAKVILYPTAKGAKSKELAMTKAGNGVWSVSVNGDLHGTFYNYEFESYGETRLTTDINCFSANRDSTRSMIVDLDRTDPKNWPSQPKLRHKSQTDAILYELHVRDFTVNPNSGVKPEFLGKYAGMGQRGTTLPGTKFKTGLDYLVDLGVTDIHLLPVQNFLLSHEGDYTWGYATNLFNVPEESYSTTPDDPVGVIREFKGMVQSMHNAGLRVVLDVVYNHTWPPDGKDSAFWQVAPYYYLRTNDKGDVLNESGVGNALHDERPMVGKYVRDSLLYWMDEYKIDGFRFDLIGMHQPESVRDWAKAMRAKRPDVILYGEPWTGGGPNRFGKGMQRGSGVAVFNDRFRGAFRGELDGSAPGFAMGGPADRNALEKAITGWIDTPGQQDGFTDSPQETVNYVSAHDNLTFWDRVEKSIPSRSAMLRGNAANFAGAAVLLSQGVPFLEGGVNLGRTKGGNGNSYDAGDKVNGYDWQRGYDFRETNEYYKGLIAIRRTFPSFRLSTAEDVRKAVKFLPASQTPPNTIAFTIDGTVAKDKYKTFLVVMHGGMDIGTINLPAGKWDLLVNVTNAGVKPMNTVSGTHRIARLAVNVYAQR